MADFIDWRGDWQLLADIQAIAVAAAERLGDVAGQAEYLRLLAIACSRLGQNDQALAHTAASLRLCQQAGDRLGEANVHFLLATVAESEARYTDALGDCQEALRLYRAAGSRPGQARMLNNIAWDYDLLGDYKRARRFCQQSLALTAELGLQDVAAAAWHNLGYAEHHLRNLAEATVAFSARSAFIGMVATGMRKRPPSPTSATAVKTAAKSPVPGRPGSRHSPSSMISSIPTLTRSRSSSQAEIAWRSRTPGRAGSQMGSQHHQIPADTGRRHATVCAAQVPSQLHPQRLATARC